MSPSESAAPFTSEKLRQLFSEAVARHRQAKRDVDAAVERMRTANEEMDAFRSLARIYHGITLREPGIEDSTRAERAMAVEQSAAAQFDPKTATIAEILVHYLRLHRSEWPLTPREISAGILKQWGRRLESASITTTRRRNEALFESVEHSKKRGAFQLREQLDLVKEVSP